ncbi:MAG: hypothetical protein R3E18_04335 [Sphingomonadaceae bacterium]|nr:hypothetical protein [Sphingomonadaceae bacterium]
MRKTNGFALLCGTALLAACGSATTGTTPVRTTTAPVSKPVRTTTAIPPSQPPRTAPGSFRPARVMQVPGLEGVIGSNADGLQRQFGLARLDVWEGDVRKLQFSGDACVLDIYLYPAQPGAEPQATYLDARRASDGLDVDRVACVKALRGR